jgi:hypothetical protein
VLGCEQLVGADFDDLRPRPLEAGTTASGGSGNFIDSGGTGGGGSGGSVGGTAGAGGSGGSDAGTDAAPDAKPDPPVLEGAFVSGAADDTRNGLRIRGRFVWHGAVRGRSESYAIEGWIE